MKDTIYDVCVIGGGYSGLVLAILCARAGLLVCVTEQNDIVGKKILSTGNGRCNFTNSKINKEAYYNNIDIDYKSYKNSIEFLNSIGIVEKENAGYFYPYTNQAATVREAFDSAIRNLQIKTLLNCQVYSVEFDNFYYTKTSLGTYISQKLVIATGGLATPVLGASSVGYDIAQQYKMALVHPTPALVGIKSKETCLKSLAGVRALGKVSYKDHFFSGEIQFNKDGLSGYPVMCLSHYIGKDEIPMTLDTLWIDFIFYMSLNDLKAEIDKRFLQKELTLLQALNGLCNSKVIEVVLRSLNIVAEKKLKNFDNIYTDKIANLLKAFPISIISTLGFDRAQVTSGGIDLNELNLKTMESKKRPGLYFVGEVVDVDGICGGYNLEWARYSAALAAEDIIKLQE